MNLSLFQTKQFFQTMVMEGEESRWGKVCDPGCAAQAACRFSCTELPPLFMSARFKPPYTTNRQSSKAHQHVLSSNSFRLLTRLKKIMCSCVLLGFSPQNQKQFRNVFSLEWNFKNLGAVSRGFFYKTCISLHLCNLTFCCFCHLDLVNAGQVSSSAGFSISRMSEGHTQDSGILGSCESLAASLKLHEKQHNIKIHSSKCFKVQM